MHLEKGAIERERYHTRSRVKEINVGQRVYITAVPKQGVSKKLQPLFEGPYRVIKKISDVVYRIKNIGSGREVSIHTDRIKSEDSLSTYENKNVRRAYPVHEQIDSGKDKAEPANANEGDESTIQLGISDYSDDPSCETELNTPRGDFEVYDGPSKHLRPRR